ncbi:hypothetical protein KEM55_008120, partial [Ascosphaera atra]
TRCPSSPATRAVPSTPFRVLDAPLLRDDYYCTALAYSPTAHAIAVGLGSRVYLWSEAAGAECPPLRHQPSANYVTSLSFSSAEGGHSILAVGRQGGNVSLWSTFDDMVRFELALPCAVACLAWRQGPLRKKGMELVQGCPAGAEELAVGDEVGNVWYYAVVWGDKERGRERRRAANVDDKGKVILVAKIQAHSQQICGIAWSHDGMTLATGGNDNKCLLFDLPKMLRRHVVDMTIAPSFTSPDPRSAHHHQHRHRQHHCPLYTNLHAMYSSLGGAHHSALPIPPPPASSSQPHGHRNPHNASRFHYRSRNQQIPQIPSPPPFRTIYVPSNRQKHTLNHAAAVKAIAFAPWEPSLLATGGGSNDRCIHFFHAPSGSCLATINVHAQVTSLIWSRTRREVAATFG